MAGKERRYGFAGLSDEEYDALASGPATPGVPAGTPPVPPRPLESHPREDAAVDVVLSEGVTVRVVLAPGWRAHLTSSELADRVAAVTNQRLAASRLGATAPAASALHAGDGDVPVDLTPWGGSLARLVADARRDIEAYERAVHRVQHRSHAARSRGGHVGARGTGGHVDGIDIDPHWAGWVHFAEIAHELGDALTSLHAAGSPELLRHGPSAPASVALVRLAQQPDALLRAAGLTT